MAFPVLGELAFRPLACVLSETDQCENGIGNASDEAINHEIKQVPQKGSQEHGSPPLGQLFPTIELFAGTLPQQVLDHNRKSLAPL